MTLSLPRDLVRRAKAVAARRDRSLSALVAELLAAAVREEESYEKAWAAEEQLLQTGLPMRVGDITWTRDEVHSRYGAPAPGAGPSSP